MVRTPSPNNAVGASARCARSGVHGAYGALERIRFGEVGRYMAGGRSCLAPRRQPLNVIRNRRRATRARSCGDLETRRRAP